MKTKFYKFRAGLIIAIANLLIITSGFGQYTKILDFTGANNGLYPRGSLVSDGTFFYGMTNEGGSNNMGVAFKIKPDGSGFAIVLDFSGEANGSHPMGSLIFDGTFLYGMTNEGGSIGYGVIFKMKPDGSEFTKLLDFSGAAIGGNPTGSLISDGTFLYGMTQKGGTNDMGVVFKIKTDGSEFTKLLDFSGADNGGYPSGSLISDGTFLYGMTYSGGIYNMGVVFKIKPDGSGFTKLLDFSGEDNGRYPYGSLISDGTFLYGMTNEGGTFGYGIIFKVKPDGSEFTKLLEFSGLDNGSNPYGSLIYDGTFLYGMTEQGGTNWNGTAFKIMPDGTGFTKLLDFSDEDNGRYPKGSLISDGTFFYGMTHLGGTNDLGVVFKIKPDGTGFTKLLDFSGEDNGRYPYGSLISDGTFLYGMTREGGIYGYNGGVVFKIKPDGTGFTKLFDFSGVNNGSNPESSLISDGTFLYGMTEYGGANSYGVVFKVKPDGSEFSKLLSFTGMATGSSPFGSLIYDGTFLYGMTQNGGTNYGGVIFKIKPDGTGFSKLLDFSGEATGSSSYGSFITDGTFLYGMTYSGGINHIGVIFKIKPDGTGFTKLLDFSGAATGCNPYGSLISDGTFLYGMTNSGGIYNHGVVFKIKPDGTGFTKLLDFSGEATGSNPKGSLISDGTFLYGMTNEGGAFNKGVVFKIKPDGSEFTKLLDFSGEANGAYPNGSLISDGTCLYGMTPYGGTNNYGVVFKYNTLGTGIFPSTKTANISIYPNPSNESINIQGIQTGYIEIMDLNGRVIKNIDVSSETISIDISKMPGGIYLIRIKTDSGIIIRKLIKE